MVGVSADPLCFLHPLPGIEKEVLGCLYLSLHRERGGGGPVPGDDEVSQDDVHYAVCIMTFKMFWLIPHLLLWLRRKT